MRTDSRGAGMRDFLPGQHGWSFGFLPWFSEVFISWSCNVDLTRSTSMTWKKKDWGGVGVTQVVKLGSSFFVLGGFINLSAQALLTDLSWVLAWERAGFVFLGGMLSAFLGVDPSPVHPAQLYNEGWEIVPRNFLDQIPGFLSIWLKITPTYLHVLLDNCLLSQPAHPWAVVLGMGVMQSLWADQVKPEGQFVLHPWDLVPTELHV